MKKPFDRRSFLKVSGTALGIGVLYTAVPLVAGGETGEMLRWIGKKNGEATSPF